MKSRHIAFAKILTLLAAFLATSGFFLSCGDKTGAEKPEGGEIDVEFSLPEAMKIAKDEETYDFKILFGKAPEKSDVVAFQSSAASFDMHIVTVSESVFTVAIPDNLISGTYDVLVKRGGRLKKIGTTTVTITGGSDDITPTDGSNVYGMVFCGKDPVAGAVVSDGVLVTKTNEKGVYQLKSDKKYGYVFVSVPSGYDAPVDGVMPLFWSHVSGSKNKAERIDFELLKADNENYTLYLMGDMHITGGARCNDMVQYRHFMKAMSEDMEATPGAKYGLTLGDMSWDYYWYRASYSLKNYAAEISKDLSSTGITVYNTMGNHDNDFKQTGDFAMENAYRDDICPTYYSFNLGKVHFIVLDNIDYKNTPASEYDASGKITKDHRSEYVYDFTADQMNWLKKDLALVDKDTPIIMTAHAPVFRPSGATGRSAGCVQHGDGDFGSYDLLDAVKGYSKVLFFDGHTHNYLVTDTYEQSRGFIEFNAGAVCGTWWWGGYYTEGFNLSPDGTPAGYTTLTVNGTDFKWKYDIPDYSDNYQFRAYDMNEVRKKYSDLSDTFDDGKWKDRWDGIVAGQMRMGDNTVLLNIWNWDSKWTLEVTDLETGEKLDATPVRTYDPLHLITNTYYRYYKTKATTFVSDSWQHFFTVTASSAASDLEIKVTDRFGRVFTQTMERPLALDTENYRPNLYN